MATMVEIEAKAQGYSIAREAVAGAVAGLQEEIAAAEKKYMATIRKAVAVARDRQAELHAAVEASPELFTKPRTRTFHGVQVGYRKGKGSITWDDEAKVIHRIRDQLPADQVELLIRTEEHVHKPAVQDLTAADLKRLGIQVKGGSDFVVVECKTSEVDKLVAALLEEGVEEARA